MRRRLIAGCGDLQLEFESYSSFWNQQAATPEGALAAVDGSASESIVRRTGQWTARQVRLALDPAPDHRVLELGCGVGRIGRELAGCCGHWHGVDISQSMLKVAAERLDDLLWTFRDGSFVPHCLSGVNDGTEGSPVVIGSDPENVAARDLLINLGDDIPAFADAFPRVAEVVTSDENCRLLSRKRYATYRDQGHTINTHKL